MDVADNVESPVVGQSESVSTNAVATTSTFFSSRRLQLAREFKRWNQTELAKQVGLSAAAISQFENGGRPARGTLLTLAEKLERPVDFFTIGVLPSSRPLGDPIAGPNKGYFRSHRKTPAKDRRHALALTHVVRDLAEVLNTIVRLPKSQVPRFAVEPTLDGDGPERAARFVRAQWALQSGPVDNMLFELESRGIICARYKMDSDAVDAFSVPFPEFPVVVLGRDKNKRDRERFSAAHELGHLTMHEVEQAGTEIAEEQAQRFAAEFLMPAEDIAATLPSTVDWEAFTRLKLTWNVSLRALLKRSHTLGLMPTEVHQQGERQMRTRGWWEDEPTPLGVAEVPRLLCVAAQQAYEVDGSTSATFAERTGWPEFVIDELLAENHDPRPTVNL